MNTTLLTAASSAASRRNSDQAVIKITPGSSLGRTQSHDRGAFHFDMDSEPRFVLSGTGVILHSNQAAEHLLKSGDMHRDARGHLVFGDSDVQSKASAHIAQMVSGRSTQHRLMRRTFGQHWSVVQLEKRRYHDDIDILVTVKDCQFCQTSALDAVQDAFGLTLTESTVVKHMVDALSPKEIAGEMDISTNTVRAHLRSIYSKTGVRGYHRTLRLVLQMMS